MTLIYTLLLSESDGQTSIHPRYGNCVRNSPHFMHSMQCHTGGSFSNNTSNVSCYAIHTEADDGLSTSRSRGQTQRAPIGRRRRRRRDVIDALQDGGESRQLPVDRAPTRSICDADDRGLLRGQTLNQLTPLPAIRSKPSSSYSMSVTYLRTVDNVMPVWAPSRGGLPG